MRVCSWRAPRRQTRPVRVLQRAGIWAVNTMTWRTRKRAGRRACRRASNWQRRIPSMVALASQLSCARARRCDACHCLVDESLVLSEEGCTYRHSDGAGQRVRGHGATDSGCATLRRLCGNARRNRCSRRSCMAASPLPAWDPEQRACRAAQASMALARAALDHERFATAWAHGVSLAVEEAIALARSPGASSTDTR